METHLIINCLRKAYGIAATALHLLPLGADPDASIYQAEAKGENAYFVKVKRGLFNETSVALLDLLEKAGIEQLIQPIKTTKGAQFQQEKEFALIVYPFVKGEDGFSRSLSNQQWITLGQTLRRIHEVEVPESLKSRIRQEQFSPKWRNLVRELCAANRISITDEIGSNFWKFFQEHRLLIQKLVDRADELSQEVRSHLLKFVLCHSDIHAGNVLIEGKESLYIVDWDDPILAPKERDLMFIGGGIGNVWNQPHEERLFYEGYGETEIDWPLLSYYRHERIVEDIAVYSQEILLHPKEGTNKVEMYNHFTSQFDPGGVVDIAFAPKTHFVRISCGKMAYWDSKPNANPYEPTLIFIHGHFTNKRFFSAQFDSPLFKEYRIICIDLPGYGESEAPHDPERVYSWPGYAASAAEVVRALNLQNIVIVGWSLGGHVALEITSHLPQLKGLLITGTPPIEVSPEGFSKGFKIANPKTLECFGKPNLNPEEIEFLARENGYDGSLKKQFIKDAIIQTDEGAKVIYPRSILKGVGRNEIEIVRNWPHPIAVVAGADENLVNNEYIINEVPFAHLWGGCVHLIEHAGHFVHMEQPELFNEIVLKFARDVF